MRFKKGFWLRMVPVLIIVIVTALMSVCVYFRMLDKEKENCWERLEIATRSTAGKIAVRLTDNLNFLNAVSDSYVLTQNLEKEDKIADYLTSVMEMTVFERISVLFPDGYFLTQTGEHVPAEEDINYEEIVAKGLHISQRRTSPLSGKEVLYCYAPVEYQGEVQAVLVGTLDCQTLSEIFEVFTYGKDAQLFLIDRADGQYLIDNWHSELGNIYELGNRKSIDGDGMVDMITPVINGEALRMEYISQTNGVNSYQYCTPVDGYNWELCVVVQEDVVFEHVWELHRILITVGIVEIFLLIAYLVWNIAVSYAAVRNEEHMKKLESEKAMNEARSKFISNMSHDVRTPLNGIVGMLQIIRNHRDNETMVDDCLDKIEISTNYLATLASDMLDINELESNKLLIALEAIDLRQMAKELDVMVAQKAKDAGVTYQVDCSKLIHPYVMASGVHIKRILVNLIGNAIKYSKDSGANVCVLMEEEKMYIDHKQANYRFIVKDNGIGMSEEFQKTMYNAFEQEKVSARSSYEGYGLGLTIVRQLVNKMGGTIELESEKGKGSTFTVILPLEIDRNARTEKREPELVADLSGMHILLVEDNEINMEIAEVLLSDAGATVTTAVNGKLATEIFEASKLYTFDLVLMDLMMPVMDGCEATRVIRKMERPDAAEIPILAMTASAFAEEIEHCKEAGMNEHIAKPLDVKKLMSCIAKYRK